MSYHIRKALPIDAKAISDCIRESFEKYVSIIRKEPEPMTLDYIEVIKNEHVFILEEDSEVVGAIVLSDGDESFMWIEVLGVCNKYQNKGFGKMLIEFGETVMRERGAKESHIKTNVKFERVIQIYKHLDYEEYDRKTERGYDRVFLRKTL